MASRTRQRYPAWPGNVPGYRFQGKLQGKKFRGGGRQSDTDEPDTASTRDQKRDYELWCEED